MTDINFNEIKEKLSIELSKYRYEHSLGVMKEARDLALFYGADEKKAALAGLLHDCGKYKDEDKMLKKAQSFGIMIEDYNYKNYQRLHADLGYYLAKEEYGVKDKEVLLAIKHHVFGKKHMSKLEKIIYIADLCEPKRNFADELDELRKIKYDGLDNLLLKAIDFNIVYLIKKSSYINKKTLDMRNNIILKKRGDSIWK